METTQSAFKPVRDLDKFEFFVGYERVESTCCCQSSSHEDEIKLFRNKRWTMEQKLVAVRTAKKMGMSKAINFLQKTNPNEFSKLSISTLKYWVEQSNGRKKRYYD
ncbi:hypothetical protein EHI8A_127910 [Entamoeba histolytica HM-1:IMSS-B]|uniref:Uncharacterized protein n=6 Tax=Entamoeba histolytica TaxID=5759 RepID=C4M5Q5_ENTH1|nr:hypothetical protein EHI_129880 [Entamoeba histolytica HM-1:IMSS]EMD45913.1 Hypothetical protein EHI5A_066950 [Entamoeba histolytica KU27]EMH72992.1 hypothetical protein EHI8A_127910 [Entamoeba histolytica HM-1:IMSS-B]EMS11942.1 hypothetical protein KM1_020070 [Entamoeba histolytica HM-3:IMSS]ENY63668.1 hypothetical protein EHI7A_081720 [Entamoeba histolytica HM-1:IMSS-A]GAT96775.1 hypothetical protein CL6EHI_129880 [Entamoeba histolytica]|eukprot:XP_651814.1 hypothetical protein EHI_129880 [Entamoeba histolytica HM-1:IMSS]